MKYYVVDAFADAVFKGNPAGVCLLEGECDDVIMQNIAAENNLSETAFVTKREGYYDLRWFTPNVEIDLCGHATLGSAYVVMNYLETTAKGDTVDFVSRFFAPNMGVAEDPVTGSAHTGLIPLWAERLNKKKMTAVQLSQRSGTLFCEECGDRVKIAGKAILYLQGEIFINGTV